MTVKTSCSYQRGSCLTCRDALLETKILQPILYESQHGGGGIEWNLSKQISHGGGHHQ